MMCEDCRTQLVDPFADQAREFPENVWKYIRLQYGARRGMIVRVLAVLMGPVVGLLLLRRALVLPGWWPTVGALGAATAGVLTWGAIHRFAGEAVRVWVLRRGRLRKARLARAILRRALR
jgi:hypothetical protein